jgi:hypothetical protein
LLFIIERGDLVDAIKEFGSIGNPAEEIDHCEKKQKEVNFRGKYYKFG